MRLSKKQKKYIKKNYRKTSVEDISDKLNVSKSVVSAFLGDKLNKTTTPKLSIKNYLKENRIFIILTLLFTVILYGYSLLGEFVSADDVAIINDPAVSTFGEALKSLNLNTIVFSALLNTFGQNPLVFHFRSALLHLINVVLVFILSYQLFDKKVSQYSTILFALHPVNTETIAWISAGGYLFNSAFMLSSLIIYNLFHSTNNKKYLVLAVSIYALAFLFLQSPWLLVAKDQIHIRR